MKKAKWIIVNLGDSDDVQSLAYAVQEIGRESKIISLKHAYENIIDMPDDNHEVVIHKGPIGVSIGFKKSHPNWIGNFHNKDTFRCLTYYSYWGKYITQSRYLFSTYAEIVRRKDWLYENFSVNDKLFQNRYDYLELYIGKKATLVLFHYPINTWNQCHRGSLHGFGHCHLTKEQNDKRINRSADVGVDANNYMPWKLEDLVNYLYPRAFADHHSIKCNSCGMTHVKGETCNGKSPVPYNDPIINADTVAEAKFD